MKKLLLLTFLCFGVKVSAQIEPRLQRIDSLLTYLETNNKFMGSLAIREGEQLVFSKAYGFNDVSQKSKANKETKYKIGSITKTFTAVVILQLIEEKKLKLETPLASFFPNVKNADKITIEELLHQRTGIPDYLNQDSITKAEFNSPDLKESIFTKIANYDSLFEPNSKFQYSNSNYYLLGGIIEKVTKKSYAANIEKRIKKKIGLKNTIYPEQNVQISNNESYSYYNNGSNWLQAEEWKIESTFATGALVSTPTDLTQFIYSLFHGKLLKSASLEQMTLLKEGYGKALLQFPFGERRFYGHNGIIENFTSVLGYYPSENLSISLITNGDNFNQNDIILGILSIYYKIPFPFPSFEKLDQELIEKYIGTYGSKDIPLKITIFEKEGELLAQPFGQNPFTLVLKDKKTFVFAQAGVEIVFNEASFVLIQGGAKFNFIKE